MKADGVHYAHLLALSIRLQGFEGHTFEDSESQVWKLIGNRPEQTGGVFNPVQRLHRLGTSSARDMPRVSRVGRPTTERGDWKFDLSFRRRLPGSASLVCHRAGHPSGKCVHLGQPLGRAARVGPLTHMRCMCASLSISLYLSLSLHSQNSHVLQTAGDVCECWSTL